MPTIAQSALLITLTVGKRKNTHSATGHCD